MFEVGDVVALRSGGPRMVVVGIDEPHPDYVMPEPREFICQWITAAGDLRAASFPAAVLVMG